MPRSRPDAPASTRIRDLLEPRMVRARRSRRDAPPSGVGPRAVRTVGRSTRGRPAAPRDPAPADAAPIRPDGRGCGAPRWRATGRPRSGSPGGWLPAETPYRVADPTRDGNPGAARRRCVPHRGAVGSPCSHALPPACRIRELRRRGSASHTRSPFSEARPLPPSASRSRFARSTPSSSHRRLARGLPSRRPVAARALRSPLRSSNVPLVAMRWENAL